LAKFGKLPKLLRIVEKAIIRAEKDIVFAERAMKYLKPLRGSIDKLLATESLRSKLPDGAVDKLNAIKKRLDKYLNAPKKRCFGLTGKEAASDVPSWVRGQAPTRAENGKEFARRMMDRKYGIGNWTTKDKEYSRIQKFGDRGFELK
jgi:hypothetical protein